MDAWFFEFASESDGVSGVGYDRCEVGQKVQRGKVDAEPRVQAVQEPGGKVWLPSVRVAPQGMDATAAPA